MGSRALHNEEKVGLAAALVLHGALVAVLLMQTVRSEVSVFPERMTVNLTTEVGLKSAAPDPVAESRAAVAPTLADEPAPAPQPEPAPAPPQRVERPSPIPTPQPRLAPRPQPAPPTRQPAPTRERSRPDRAAPKPAASTAPAPAKPATKGGGSRIGEDFLSGAGSSTTTQETRVPASQIGASAKASLIQQISREIRPHWQPPSGADVEQLASYLRFRLNPDGSLAGKPELVRQAGVNEANRAQAGRHAELAIRAVQRAAPFDLPEQYYEAWKVVGPLEFNWELSQ